MVIVKDDVLPEETFKKLQQGIVYHNDCVVPWYPLRGAAYRDESSEISKYDLSFSHLVYTNGQPNSSLSPFVESCITTALSNVNVEIKRMIRIRLGLIPLCPINFIHDPHVDMHISHKVGLMYLNTTDGDTFLYNEKYDPIKGESSYRYLKNNLNGKVTVKQRITPKENRLLCFDGLYYHSSSAPTNVYARFAINFNFI